MALNRTISLEKKPGLCSESPFKKTHFKSECTVGFCREAKKDGYCEKWYECIITILQSCP